MKKVMSLLICGVMMFGLVGCNESKKEPSKNIPVAVNQEESEKEKAAKEEERRIAKEKEEKEKAEKDEALRIKTEKDEADRVAKVEAENVMAEESKIVYAELINDIENSIPEMTVKYIKETQDSKVMSIDMDLLSSIDVTLRKCVELTVKKETAMKNEDITKISKSTLFRENQKRKEFK